MDQFEYKSSRWLGKGASTSSVVAFDGIYTTGEGRKMDYSFLEVSDCGRKIRLHRTDGESAADFVQKIRDLRSEISAFIGHLEKSV